MCRFYEHSDLLCGIRSESECMDIAVVLLMGAHFRRHDGKKQEPESHCNESLSQNNELVPKNTERSSQNNDLDLKKTFLKY